MKVALLEIFGFMNHGNKDASMTSRLASSQFRTTGKPREEEIEQAISKVSQPPSLEKSSVDVDYIMNYL
jgi:hypothetical protein